MGPLEAPLGASPPHVSRARGGPMCDFSFSTRSRAHGARSRSKAGVTTPRVRSSPVKKNSGAAAHRFVCQSPGIINLKSRHSDRTEEGFLYDLSESRGSMSRGVSSSPKNRSRRRSRARARHCASLRAVSRDVSTGALQFSTIAGPGRRRQRRAF